MANEEWNNWRIEREDIENIIAENAHMNASLNDLNLNFINIFLALF